MTGQHYSRLVTARWWFDFLGTAERISKICLQGREYTMADVYEYTKKQSSSSLATILAAASEVGGGGMALIEQMAVEAEPNKRQKMALDAYRTQRQQAKNRLEQLRRQMDAGKGEFYE